MLRKVVKCAPTKLLPWPQETYLCNKFRQAPILAQKTLSHQSQRDNMVPHILQIGCQRLVLSCSSLIRPFSLCIVPHFPRMCALLSVEKFLLGPYFICKPTKGSQIHSASSGEPMEFTFLVTILLGMVVTGTFYAPSGSLVLTHATAAVTAPKPTVGCVDSGGVELKAGPLRCLRRNKVSCLHTNVD
jgi:hypothetical protein